MSRVLFRTSTHHAGMTLFSCSLVLLGVAMLASASLHSLQGDVSLTYGTIDRLLAQQAAEAALRDAAATLSMIPRNLTIVQAQGLHYFGDITGERFPHGGPTQSAATPDYFLEILPQLSNADLIQPGVSAPHRYRVTAKGKGLNETTMVVLQAEFETQTCDAEKLDMKKDAQDNRENGLQSSVQNSEQNDDKAFEQSDAECTPYVRRLAWRVLRTS